MWQIHLSNVSGRYIWCLVFDLRVKSCFGRHNSQIEEDKHTSNENRLTRCSRLKNGRSSPPTQPGSEPNTIASLRDEDQPFIYDIRFSKKKFTLELYDTANPNQHWSSLKPDVVVLAYDISNRATLDGLKTVLFFPEPINHPS
jgi:hypothetical protein